MSNQSGAPTICLAWSPYARLMRSSILVFRVIKCPPLNPKFLPVGLLGRLGLMVATSRLGSAFAAICIGLGVGKGIVHSVSGVARVKIRGTKLDPWVHAPVMVFPSKLSLPSYVAEAEGRVILST